MLQNSNLTVTPTIHKSKSRETSQPSEEDWGVKTRRQAPFRVVEELKGDKWLAKYQSTNKTLNTSEKFWTASLWSRLKLTMETESERTEFSSYTGKILMFLMIIERKEPFNWNGFQISKSKCALLAFPARSASSERLTELFASIWHIPEPEFWSAWTELFLLILSSSSWAPKKLKSSRPIFQLA